MIDEPTREKEEEIAEEIEDRDEDISGEVREMMEKWFQSIIGDED
jgi:hypothetical protein